MKSSLDERIDSCFNIQTPPTKPVVDLVLYRYMGMMYGYSIYFLDECIKGRRVPRGRGNDKS